MPNVILQGLGPIGQLTARTLLSRNIPIVGAIDIDPQYSGRALTEILGMQDYEIPKGMTDVRVSPLTDQVYKQGGNEGVILMATKSDPEEMFMPIVHAMEAGYDVVTPAEGLFFSSHDLIYRLEEEAQRLGKKVIARGVNPGYLMDVRPGQFIESLGDPEEITEVTIIRHDDTSNRRGPLHKKTGVGRTTRRFYDGIMDGEIGHVGLIDSAMYVADVLGWEEGEVNFLRLPVLGNEKVMEGGTSFRTSLGIYEQCHIQSGGKHLCLDLQMYKGAANFNGVFVKKNGQNYASYFGGLVDGDQATAHVLRQHIENIHLANPGVNFTDFIPNVNDGLLTMYAGRGDESIYHEIMRNQP